MLLLVILTLKMVYTYFFWWSNVRTGILSRLTSLAFVRRMTIWFCGRWALQSRADFKTIADFFPRTAIAHTTKNICIFSTSICVIDSSTRFVDGICLRAILCDKKWSANCKANTSYEWNGLHWIAKLQRAINTKRTVENYKFIWTCTWKDKNMRVRLYLFGFFFSANHDSDVSRYTDFARRALHWQFGHVLNRFAFIDKIRT